MEEENIVLDIEGTVCPIEFVHDILFPYALRRAQAEIPSLNFPLDPQRSQLEAYLADFPAEFRENASDLLAHIQDLINRDVKASYLKALQGYLWKAGYETGEIKAPVFEDAVTAIRKWSASKKVYIYSSGSVGAQKLFFKYTNAGDLTGLISGYFDTVNAGPKMEKASYDKIAAEIGGNGSTRFFSDNPKEIDAAHAAGWATTFTVRPGNPKFPSYQWPDQKTTEFEA